MKAVNLLPVDARHASGNVTLRGASPATLGLLGGLALALVVAFGYVALANGVADRRAELASVNAQTGAAQQRAAALKPYGDLETLRSTTMDHVRALAGGRYDWPTVLSRFARALPADATLTAFNGSMAATAGATGAPAGPTVSLTGCTTSHASVGSIMDRLRSVTAVSDVTLQSSTVSNSTSTSTSTSTSSGSSTGAGGCGRAETFALTVTLDALPGATATSAAAAAAAATATASPASTTTTTPATTSTTPAATTTPAPATTTTPAATTAPTASGGTP